MRANDIPPLGFTPESDTTSAASPGRSPPRRVFHQAHPIGYPDANSIHHHQQQQQHHGRLWMHDNPGRTHAPRACEKCRLSKRKCDKKLPHCDRCLRLNARCHYLPDPISANANANGAPIVVYQQSSLSHDLMLRHADPLAAITASQILALIPSQTATPAGPEPADWRASVSDFFTYIHPWFAVVHPILFERQIVELLSLPPSAAPHEPSPPLATSQPSPVSSNSHLYQHQYHHNTNPMSIKNAVSGGTGTGTSSNHSHSHSHQTSSSPETEHHLKHVALLVVAMHLITQLRCTEAGCRPMFGPPYRAAKRLLALMLMGCSESAQLPSLELAQCGAVVALYEYGHGDAAAAYRTLGETVAAASVLGVRPGLVDPGGEKPLPGLADPASLSGMEREQRGGLWWGMFILDQFIHKDEGTHHLPFLVETPSESTLLPETPPAPLATALTNPGGPVGGGSGGYKIEVQPRYPTSVVVGTVRLGAFQLSAKVASLLHRALRIDKERDPRPVRMPRTATFADLDHEVRRTSHTLLEQSIQWEAMLDCFAMLVSALFTLYLPYLHIIEHTTPAVTAADTELATALAALRFACKLSTDVSCKINQEIDATPMSAPLPRPLINNFNSINHLNIHNMNINGGVGSMIPGSIGVGVGIGSGDTKKKKPSLAILAAPAGATCYAVIVALAVFSRIFPGERERCREAIAEKFESLRLFSLRWGIAEEMIRQLEEKRGINRSDYMIRLGEEDEDDGEEEEEDGSEEEGGAGELEGGRPEALLTPTAATATAGFGGVDVGGSRMVLG